MSYSTVLVAVKTILDGVSGIGKTYDYERWSADWASWKTLFTSSGKLNACTITREACPEEDMVSQTNRRTHSIVIRLYYALDDSAASEKTAQNLVEAIATAFRVKPDLDASVIESGPISLRVFDVRMFGSTLVHYAEMVFPVTEEEQY